eukprot:Protomagalhaensia_sp_Gyna_25__1005@NODE_1487_length_1797_cov_28_112059_g1204_i0_p1_GENE_NODE_1487_length_1797_cov_28_112059_g1204_i0NODE_1487_length_1797_cov_28_112059_g1204_i0_p1_ORF_typecomplete_len545_score58_14Sugar_tr/PF00083_24/4_6e86MFS_1/PF07690_16/1_8e21MFS_1/PF07690_16/1_5e07OATP/PF03137_20/0_059PTR2/PF00854_21/0_24_NODE_1487_length_1797_cov_28_112059_g1204_i0741708
MSSDHEEPEYLRASTEPDTSAKAKHSIAVPDLTETIVNWSKVDRATGWLSCVAFPTLLVLISTAGSFSFGINTAILNTAANYIAADFGWCDYEGYVTCDRATWYKSSVSTAVFLGAALGALTAGRYMNNGPRLVTMGSLVVYFVGITASILSNGFTSLLFARLIVGYGVGISSAATPVYISEIAPKAKRGFYGSFHQNVLSLGQLIAVALGLAFVPLPDDPRTGTAPSAEQMVHRLTTFDRVWWRVMLGLALLPVIMAAAFMGPLFTFETPQYYIRKRDDNTARELLSRIHKKPNVEEEIQEAKDLAGTTFSGIEQVSFITALKKPGYLRAFLVGAGVSFFQQITGVNAYVSASNRLFGDAGLSGKYTTYASLGFIAVALPCNLLCTALVERLGRRTLLTWGSIGTVLAVTPATIFYWMEWNRESNSNGLIWSAICGAILFMALFSLSAGPVTWLYIFEIFPMDIKATASSICVAVNWMGGIIMVFMGGLLPSKYAFSIFFVSGLLYVVFSFSCIEETKGRPMGDSPYVPARNGLLTEKASITV